MEHYIKTYLELLNHYESSHKIGIKSNHNNLLVFNQQLKQLFLQQPQKPITKDNYEIVIARYNEPIDYWQDYLPISTIYNKGKNNLQHTNIILDNVGRESHTYLYHIINNWDNLAETTLFTQCNMSMEHKPFPIPIYLLSHYDMTIHLWNHDIDFIGHQPWGFIKHSRKWLQEYNNNHMNKSKYSFGQWWDNFLTIDKPLLTEFKWSHGGIFSIKKNQIKKKPLQYYQKLITTIENHINPEEGHYFERSWYYIFQ